MMIMENCDTFDRQYIWQRRNIEIEYGWDQGNSLSSAVLQAAK